MVYPSTTPTAGQILYDIARALSAEFDEQTNSGQYWFTLSSAQIEFEDLLDSSRGKDLKTIRDALVRERWEVATGGNRNSQSVTPEDWETDLWRTAQRDEPGFEAALMGLELETALSPRERDVTITALLEQRGQQIDKLRFDHAVMVVGADPRPDASLREDLDRAVRSMAAQQVMEAAHQALGWFFGELGTLDVQDLLHSEVSTQRLKTQIATGSKASLAAKAPWSSDLASADPRQTALFDDAYEQFRAQAEEVLREGFMRAQESTQRVEALSAEQISELRSLADEMETQISELLQRGISQRTLMPPTLARNTFKELSPVDAEVERLHNLNNVIDQRISRAVRFAAVHGMPDVSQDSDSVLLASADAFRAEAAAGFVRDYRSVRVFIAPDAPEMGASRSL